MYSVEIKKHKNGYNVIRLFDKEGFVCSYSGYDNWAFLLVLAEYGIDCRQ